MHLLMANRQRRAVSFTFITYPPHCDWLPLSKGRKEGRRKEGVRRSTVNLTNRKKGRMLKPPASMEYLQKPNLLVFSEFYV